MKKILGWTWGIVLVCATLSGAQDQDARRVFEQAVAGRDARNFETVLNDVQDAFYDCGMGQQKDSHGAPRGRLYLPTPACPDASPNDPLSRQLGVRQVPACWDRVVDVVHEGTTWEWLDYGGTALVPLKCQAPEVPNPTQDDLKAKVEELQTLLDILGKRLDQIDDRVDGIGSGIQALDTRVSTLEARPVLAHCQVRWIFGRLSCEVVP